jgi:tRNA pseudouridine55 synthase
VRVEALEVVAVAADASSVDLELTVSKGYYVRALARDLGSRLGVPAHLAALRRLASGTFTLDDAVAWPRSERAPLITLEDAVARVALLVQLNAPGERRARCGQPLSADDFVEDPAPAHATRDLPVVGWTDASGRLVALGRREPDGAYRVVRGFTRTPGS